MTILINTEENDGNNNNNNNIPIHSETLPTKSSQTAILPTLKPINPTSETPLKETENEIESEIESEKEDEIFDEVIEIDEEIYEVDDETEETKIEQKVSPQTSLRTTSVYKEPNGFVVPPDTRKPVSYDMCKEKCGRYLTVVNNHGARFGHYFATW